MTEKQQADMTPIAEQIAGAMRDDPYWLFQSVMLRTRFRDWEFSLDRELRPPRVFLMTRMQTVNSSNEDLPLWITHMHELPSADELKHEPMDFDDVVQWFMDRVVDIWRHEAMEFFHVDEGRPFNPSHEWGSSYVMHRISSNFLVERERNG